MRAHAADNTVRNEQIVRWNVWSGQTDVEEHYYLHQETQLLILVLCHKMFVELMVGPLSTGTCDCGQ